MVAGPPRQQIQASQAAFAAILRDGSVVTWGDAGNGGDSSAAPYSASQSIIVVSLMCGHASFLTLFSLAQAE